MIESIFLWIMSVGIITLILGIELETIIYNMISIFMWIVVLATHIYIQVPADTSYWEVALLPISLGFIFVNVIVIILGLSQETFLRRHHLR